MSWLTIILIAAAALVALGLLAILGWLLYTGWLNRLERRLATRKGPYREIVAGLATRERTLLDPAIRQLGTLHDLEALEAVLEEQARALTERPAWLLDAYDRLGLVDKYTGRLRTARRWRERAFAAELLGRVGNAQAVPALLETVRATRSEDADVREIALRALARIGDPRAVDPLVAALRTADVWLAPRIADILTRHGELAVAPMIALLEEGTRHPSRAWAANVLGEVRAQRAFAPLVRALGDLDDEVRAKAAHALGRLGDGRATPYLLEHLLTDPAPFVRARIAGALGRFGDPEVIERLVRSLGDPAWWVRMRSVEALEQIGEAAEGPLLVALDDPDPEIRSRSAVALERLGLPARVVGMIERDERPREAGDVLAKFASAGARELLAEQMVHTSPRVRAAVIAAVRRTGRRDLSRELVAAARGDREPAIRAAAFDALRALGLRDAVPAGLAGLGDPSEAVRAAALALLGDLGGPELGHDVRQLAGDPEPAVRAAAVRALGLIRATDAEPEFDRLLTDPAPEVRAAAAEGAAAAEVRNLAPAVARLLGDSEEPVRISGAAALGRIGGPDAVWALTRDFPAASPALRDVIAQSVARLDPGQLPTLVDSLMGGGDPASKLAVTRVLGHAPPETARRVLLPLVHDPDPGVRSAAVGGLGRVGGAVLPVVEEALRDPDETVRAAAADAAARLDDPQLGAALIPLLRADPSPQVRERAAVAIGLLRPEGGGAALAAALAPGAPAALRAALVLGLGAYEHESMAGRVAAMTDDDAVRAVLQERLRDDPEYRLLGRRLRQSRSLELRALAALSRDQMEQELTTGMRSALDPAERLRLVAGLRAFQGERSRDSLLQAVRADPAPEVRASALQSVATMLPPEELRLAATRALGDPSLGVRRAAIALFAGMPAGEALPALLQALRADDDPSVLRAAGRQAGEAFDQFVDAALGESASGREAVVVARVAQYVQHPELARLVPPLARHREPAVRAAVARLITARPELADEPLIRGLASDPVIEVRRAAAQAAATAHLPVLLAQLTGDPDPGVRREVAGLLTDFPEGEALGRLLADREPSVRAAAAVSAILRGELTALPDSVNPADAAEAVVNAGQLADYRETARTAPDERHRLAAALALAIVGDQVAREVAAADPVPAVRAAVAAMLQRTG